MFKILKTLPFIVLLTACSSTFGNNATQALSYQEALQQNPKNVIGQTIIVGGPVISYQHTQNTTHVEIASAPLNAQNAPSNQARASERAIIVIKGHLAPEQLEDVRMSAIGQIKDIQEMKRYGNSIVIMITADQYKIWRSAKPMFDPSSKPRYGYTYQL